MTSISYAEIFSRFFTKVEAYDLLDLHKDEKMRNAILCSWLHSALSAPYVIRLFSKLECPSEDDIVNLESADNTINFELDYTINEYADKEFIVEVLSYGIALAWITPKVNSIINISQFLGSSSEKYYSQAAHIAELRNLRDDLMNAQRSLIRDRGYANNPYLDGTSSSSALRGVSE